ncbi:MAG: NAD(P)H-hydrate dehydratase, partial [Lachnospiraceae bacterium]
ETKLLLDADALNIIAKKGLLGMVKGHVLTPHLGEMSRLSGLDIASIKENNIAVAEEFATRYQCVLVMKDARTVVTDGTRTYVNVSGNDGMATGGSGDVLTGMIAGMWANGMDLMDGAILGVYLHGLAGDATREKMGPYAMTAGDILDHIHCVLPD